MRPKVILYSVDLFVYMITDKAIIKAATIASAVTGSISQLVEKSSVVTRRTHATNDYTNKKNTGANDAESMIVSILVSFA